MRHSIAIALICVGLAGCGQAGKPDPVNQNLKPGEIITIVDNGTVFFDAGSSQLNLLATQVLDASQPAEWFKGLDRVDITGHADRTGSTAGNLRLSLRRAETVRDALVARNAPASLLVVHAAGEDDPLVPTADGVAEPRNRYVTIVPH
jgi:OOP family OmpA-OmpF porin